MNVKESLLSAYVLTCHHSNVGNIHEGFLDSNQFGLIYELIKRLNSENLIVRLIFADGGVKTYQIHYKIGDYTFIIADWSWQDFPAFKSFDKFCEWLQKEIDKMPKLKIIKTLKF